MTPATGPRVVSLLPSATELLGAIPAIDLLVGRSHECDFPPGIDDRPVLTRARTTGTTPAEIDASVRALLQAHPDSSGALYDVDETHLVRLRPDVILTQELCRVCSIDLPAVQAMARRLDPPPGILPLDPRRLEDVFDDLLRVGQAVGRERDAERAMVALRARYWEAIDFVNPYIDGPRVVMLEWTDPLFVGGHWTPGMIAAAGARDPLGVPGGPSRCITPEELIAARPDRLIIAPCGVDLDGTRDAFAALARRPWFGELPAARPGGVALVDGRQHFSRPGPRLVDAFEWLVAWINDRPDRLPAGFPVAYPAPDHAPDHAPDRDRTPAASIHPRTRSRAEGPAACAGGSGGAADPGVRHPACSRTPADPPPPCG